MAIDLVTNVYTVEAGRLTCHNDTGFAAIGVGVYQAASSLMFLGRSPETGLDTAVCLTYAAKKRAEVAPGVGIETDMVYVSNTEPKYFLFGSHVISKLEKIYQQAEKVHKQINKGYVSPDPAASLRGETGMTRAEHKDLRRKESASKATGEFDGDPDEGRGQFSPNELQAIFRAPQYKTGNGAHVLNKNQVWYPFEYWLPLLGLFAACRIKEASQLHLTDLKQLDGVWCFDPNERTPDKTLKNDQSTRIVPLHPILLELGFESGPSMHRCKSAATAKS